MLGRGVRSAYPAAGDDALEARLFKAVHPAEQTVIGLIKGGRLVLLRRRDHVDIPEFVIRREERVHAVEQRFKLAAHFVVIDRRCEDYDLGVVHSGHDVRGIIFEDTFSGLLTAQTADAELQLLALEGDELHIVPSVLCAALALPGKALGIAPAAQAGGNDKNLF